MSVIDITSTGFTINGVSSGTVATTLKQAGLSNASIAEIVGGWFVGVTGSSTPAPFDIMTDVSLTDPSCLVDYLRSFAHTDWMDGESRVQAGMTPEELGFNARFHAIENEFDSIASQFNRLGACVGDIRSDLAGVVTELESKITTMQNQIHALEQADKPSVSKPELLGAAQIGGKDVFVTKFGNDFKFVEFASKSIISPPGGSVVNPGVRFRPESLVPSGVVDLVADVETTLSYPDIADLFEGGRPVSVGDLRNVASTAVLRGGVALGSVIATMPAETRFTSAAEAVSAIAEHVTTLVPAEAAAELRGAVLSGEGADRTGTALLNTGVTVVGADNDTAGLLSNAGFGTMSRLSNATTTEVISSVRATGAAVDPETVRTLVARAHVGRALRNRPVG